MFYGEWELLTCWGFTEIQNCLQIRADSTDPWALPPAYVKQKVGNPSLGVLVYPIIFMMAIGQMNGVFQAGTWNVDSLSGKAGEVVYALYRRRIDVARVQGTRWKGAKLQV